MSNIEKIKAEIERRKKRWMYDDLPIAMGRYYEDRDLLAFIDSLSEEPLIPSNSVGLKKAAKDYAILPMDVGDGLVCIDKKKEAAFIAGAKWMESQMPMPEDTVIFMKGVEEGRRLEREDRNDDNLPRITDEDFKRAVRDEYAIFVDGDPVYSKLVNQDVGLGIAKHFADLGVKWVKEEKSGKDNELPRYYGD